MGEYIYADNAATTRISDTVVEAMMPYLTENYGNPSSLYRIGRDNHAAVEDARKRIAKLIGAGAMDIYFTSCGTEADNWAVKGTMHRLAAEGKRHFITTNIEHHAIIHSAQALEADGFEVTYLPVDGKGRVTAEQVRAAIRPDTGLVSVMYANNEIGTIEPIAEIGKVCREAGVLFHTDAVQAAGILAIDVDEQNIDMMSVSAHKFNGPKGVGFLYCRRGIFPDNLMDGGAQERGHRAGTENVAYIVGMAKALEEAYENMEELQKHEASMRDKLQQELMTEFPDIRINGDTEHRLPGTLNVSFDKIDGQSLIFTLDLKGLAASSGSACASGSVDPSHVMLALGLPYNLAHGSLRLTLGRYNREDEIDKIVEIIKETVAEIHIG
ncbi:MAG: cysteine desulfurase NifS [Clostridia bacterium]|nr:cysteine desulfurase NifS [Clostridia bacterium]